MYVGRILQGVSGTGAWIVGFAMLTDAAGSKHLGKALGFAGSFITAGIITGPTIAGVLLEFFGYWPAWSVPLALLAIDFIARLAMVEEPKSPKTECSSADQDGTGHGRGEDAPLLEGQNSGATETTEEAKRVPTRGFWSIMLRQGSVYAAIFNVIAFSMVVSGFDATLPIHLRDAFGWTSAPIGSIFLALQIPAMCLSPFVGWMRDRIGLRYPTSLGWGLTAPLLWFAGVPGPDNFLGVGAGSKGQGAFIASMIGVGIVLSFARGAGTFQLTSKSTSDKFSWYSPFKKNTNSATSATLHELRAENPDIFGPGGGGSRMFSLTEMSFCTGLLLGPIVCGPLNDNFGFYYTTCALGELVPPRG